MYKRDHIFFSLNEAKNSYRFRDRLRKLIFIDLVMVNGSANENYIY